MQLGLNSKMFNAILYNVKNLVSIYKMYVTLKLDDNGCCRIHSFSDGDGPAGPEVTVRPHGNKEIVTNQRYVVMSLKMVARNGKNITLKEVVEEIEREGGRKKVGF